MTPDYFEFTRRFAGKEHWLFILACGAIVNIPSALEELKESLLFYKVPFTVGFSAETFNAHLASDFFEKFGTRVLIEGAPLTSKTVCHMLDLTWNLRRHRSVNLFRLSCDDSGNNSLAHECYVWHHPTLAPAGHVAPFQCPTCLRILSVESFYCGGFAGYYCSYDKCSFAAEWEIDYDVNSLDKYHGRWVMNII